MRPTRVARTLSEQYKEMVSKSLRILHTDGNSEKAVRRQLSQVEASLNAIIENAEMTAYSIDREFRFTHFSSYLRASLKHACNVEVKKGDSIFDILYKDDQEEAEYWKTIYLRALRGEALEFVRGLIVGNSHSYFKFRINPIRVHGKITGLTCVAIDISVQRIAEMKVRTNEARFRALTENSLNAIIVMDVDRNVVYTSSSLPRMLGSDEDTFYILTIFDLNIHEEDITAIETAYEQALMLPGVPQPTTIRVRHKLGHYIWLNGVITNMINDRSVQGLVCNFRDVTDQREIEMQREQVTNDLVKRYQDLEQYAYIIAHNLRAPIANLLGIANLLKMPTVSARDKEQAKRHILDSAGRLDNVIKDLNDILQAKSELNLHRESVGFRETVDNVIASIAGVVEKSNTVIEVDFLRHPWTITVKSYLYNIFYNLISNAIKFSRPGVSPVIKISSKRIDGRTSLRFEDNGLGLDLQTYGENVFGLYKRFHPQVADGKGMGLFMVKTYVENLGGVVSVASKVGEGSVFIILL